MNKEDFIKMYKKDKKEEIIEELFYKCNANYKYKEVLDKIKEIITSKDICIDTRKTDGSMDYVDLKQIFLELLEEIE